MKSRKITKYELPLHIMLIPGIIVVLIFSYGPMAGLIMAFQNFSPAKGFLGSEFTGLENFKFIIHMPGVLQVLWNTLSIALMKIIVGLVLPITFALLLNEVRKTWFKRTIQTMIYLPFFLSWIILGGVLIDVLSLKGIVNQVITVIFNTDPIYFLGDNKYFKYVLVITDVLKGFGFDTIIYLAALTGIDPTLYEAATIDGASRLRQVRHVTLPGIYPIIVLMVTLSLGAILNAGFEQVLVLYSPQVYQSGDIIDTFVYRLGLIQTLYGPAAAVGLFKSFISLLMISGSYFLAYRFADYRIF